MFICCTDFNMASSELLQYVIVLIILWEIICKCTAHFVPAEQVSTEQLPTQPSPCTYPHGSIPCKVWNYTNLDCSYRELDCIPPLPHATTLKVLDLSGNKISRISSNAFSDLFKLQMLDLYHNDISVLHQNAFNGLQELQHLDLSDNSISNIHGDAFSELRELLSLYISCNNLLINDNTFSGLQKLKNLELSCSVLQIPDGSPFHELISLQTLKILADNVICLTNATFVGLKSLQELSIMNIYVDNITAPFAGLLSPRSLTIFNSNIQSVADCVKVEKLFNGLDRLEYLSLSVGGQFCSDIDICPLVSLNSLVMSNGNLTNTNKCMQEIPLKMLYFSPPYGEPIYPPYALFPHLTNLSIYADAPGALKTLKSLKSPLQKLSIYFYTNLALNSTTFESFAKWNESLLILELICRSPGCSKVIIESSTFKCFSNLHSLLLQDATRSSTSFHVDTFKGLKNLQKLSLHTKYDIFASGALQTFNMYNTLKILDFNSAEMSGDILGVQLCTISSSLQTIDLSENRFSFPLYLPCILRDLKVLILDNQSSRYFTYYLESLGQALPNLHELHASNAGDKTSRTCTVDTCKFPSLTILDLSGNKFFRDDKDGVYTPCLEKIFLSSLMLNNINVLKIFKSYQLTYLSLSRNQISIISEHDATFFHNLTYLDLSSNHLTSIDNLQYLTNLKILYLNNNQIGTIPKSFLSKSKLSYLRKIKLNQNPLVCDCNIEPLAKWLLTDKVVYLQYYKKDDRNYCCVLPDSKRGLSITEIDLDCESHMWMYISISIACFVIIVVAASLAVWYRWHIQYGLFLLFNRRRNYQNYLVNNNNADQDDDDEGGLPRYDAYVTYHREDEDWVDEELVANIEEGEEPFRLCLRTRDIRAGRLIFNELSLHIQRSRKILVILSPRFVEDNWCYFELNMAHHRVLEENRNVMIFIILEEIPNNKLTLLLRQLFCRVQVIKWPGDGYGQYLFWKRLREELKRPVPLDRRFNI